MTVLHSGRANLGQPPGRHAFIWVALAMQVLAVFVITFGDVGFDCPGRFGLDFNLFLLLAVLWLLSLGAGFMLAWGARQLFQLQCLVLFLMVGGGSLAVYLQTPGGPVPPAESGEFRVSQLALASFCHFCMVSQDASAGARPTRFWSAALIGGWRAARRRRRPAKAAAARRRHALRSRASLPRAAMHIGLAYDLKSDFTAAAEAIRGRAFPNQVHGSAGRAEPDRPAAGRDPWSRG
jgi:hypothetical protein